MLAYIHNKPHPGSAEGSRWLCAGGRCGAGGGGARPRRRVTAAPGPRRRRPPTGHAKLVHGKAIPPSDAPAKVVKVIEAANQIRTSRYNAGAAGTAGGKRQRLRLLRGRQLRAPRRASCSTARSTRASFMQLGAARGKGNWITVYTNPGHAFMVVAGLRFDTSMTAGNGPGWSKEMRSSGGLQEAPQGPLLGGAALRRGAFGSRDARMATASVRSPFARVRNRLEAAGRARALGAAGGERVCPSMGSRPGSFRIA